MMGGSMQRQEYSSKHQDESENDETRGGQMAFLARGSVNAKPKGPLEASGYRNLNDGGQDLI